MSNEEVDVLLAFMPFGNPNFPSLGLSLLQAGLKNHDINSKIAYYNLAFVEAVGLERYLLLSIDREHFFGEWVFSHLAFGHGNSQDRKSHDEALLTLLEKYGATSGGTKKRVRQYELSPEELKEKLTQVRDKTEAFVDSCVEDIQGRHPKILGFSTMFSQNCSSLAVARRVKDKLGADAPTVIFGGSNCEGIMGYTMLRAFPWIDYVCCGEGDKAFVEFADSLLKGQHPKVSGIVGRNKSSLDEFSTPPPVRDMDDLPFPNFEEYFLAFRASGLDRVMVPQIAIEGSRGCWWGEVSHCTFCGLNGQTMKYRAKSDGRLFRELDYLADQWGPLMVQVVDNILNLDLFKSFFGELARRRRKFNLFFETKSNLKREQLQLLRDAGVRSLQPGIESLSDEILNEMKKGVTGLQNIWLLKTCREKGIHLSWIWLAGFPHEKPSEYERMRQWIPLLHHFQPPAWFGTIHLDRFSPNFNFPQTFGMKTVRAAHPYRLIYPLDDKMLFDLAYYFDFDYEDGRDPEGYTSALGDDIHKWMREWGISAAKPIQPVLRRPTVEKLARPALNLLGAPLPAMLGAPILAMFDTSAGIMIWDTRPCATQTIFFLKGLGAKVFRYIMDVRKTELVIQHFVDLGYPEKEVEQAVAKLVEENLAIVDSDRCLGLVPRATLSMILAAVFGMQFRIVRRFRHMISRSSPESVPPQEN